MYSIIKHYKDKTSAVLFETPCESVARMRFDKSATLLKQHESLELKHDGKLIDYRKAPDYGPIDTDDVSAGAMPLIRHGLADINTYYHQTSTKHGTLGAIQGQGRFAACAMSLPGSAKKTGIT